MSNYPWDILGITPTRDELAIRRAYARMLKKFRPDEDADGFARLVAAREYALNLLATGGVDEALAKEAEATIPPEQSEADASQGFSSGYSGETVTAAETSRFDVQAAAFVAMMNRLGELVLGTGARKSAREVHWTSKRLHFWDADEWRSTLSGLTDLTFEQRRALRDFVVREALPQLPKPPTDGADMKRLLEGGGTGAVVNIWEAEFAIRHDQTTLAPFCGAQAMLRYLDWLALAERVSPLHKRTEAERRFIDCLDKVLPPRSTVVSIETAPKEAWIPDRWEELFALVRQMETVEAARCRNLFAERLTTWLPNLPSGPLWKLNAETAPALIVEKIEDEFALRKLLDAPFVNHEGATRYMDWLAYARRMRAMSQRCAEGANAYRDAAGFPVFPPEDLPLDVLADSNAETSFALAQGYARWRYEFDLFAFLLPGWALARCGLPLAGAGLLATEIVASLFLQPFSAGPQTIATFAVVLLAIHLVLAFSTQRLPVVVAIHRVMRADRLGLINPRERRRAIAWKNPALWLTALLVVTSIIFSFFLLSVWADANSHAK